MQNKKIFVDSPSGETPAVEPSGATVIQGNAKPQTTAKPKKKRKGLMIGIIVAVLLLGAIIGIVLLGGGSRDLKEAVPVATDTTAVADTTPEAPPVDTLLAKQQAEAAAKEEAKAKRKAELEKQGYVDLGLPSGTMWKNRNEGGGYQGFYTYDEAKSKFGKRLPSEKQYQELLNHCNWTWTGGGYKVTSKKNGNSITLPAAGWRDCYDGEVSHVGSNGGYWSSTPCGAEDALGLDFRSGRHDMYPNCSCYGQSVRLVQSL